MNLIYWLYWPFAWVMKGCLFVSGQYYLIALLFFAIAMKVVLIPFAIKQQKTQIETAKFAPKERAIRKKYAGRTDKATQQKMMTEIQEAKQDAGVSLTAGCLPLVVQLVLVFILYAIVRAPITYSFNYSSTEMYDLYSKSIELIQEYKDAANKDDANYAQYISELTEYQKKLGGATEDTDETVTNKVYHIDPKYSADSLPANYEYDLAKLLKDKDTLQKIADKYEITLSKTSFDNVIDEEYGKRLPNFAFIGDTSLLDTPNISTFNWLLIIPLLVFATQFFSTKLSRKYGVVLLDANGKPVGGSLFMELGLPLISTIFCFNFSAAIGVYWVWQTLIMALQTVLLAKFMPLPKFSEEEYEAAERELKAKTKKKKRITIEVDEDDESFRDYQVVDGDKGASGEGNNGKYTYTEKVDLLAGDDTDGGSDDNDGEML